MGSLKDPGALWRAFVKEGLVGHSREWFPPSPRVGRGRPLADQKAFCCCFIFLSSGFLLGKQACGAKANRETSEAAAAGSVRLRR